MFDTVIEEHVAKVTLHHSRVVEDSIQRLALVSDKFAGVAERMEKPLSVLAYTLSAAVAVTSVSTLIFAFYFAFSPRLKRE